MKKIIVSTILFSVLAVSGGITNSDGPEATIEVGDLNAQETTIAYIGPSHYAPTDAGPGTMCPGYGPCAAFYTA